MKDYILKENFMQFCNQNDGKRLSSKTFITTLLQLTGNKPMVGIHCCECVFRRLHTVSKTQIDSESSQNDFFKYLLQV